ncbi:MAG: hypothetical protein O3B24_11765 [Verrucomicrobia bacterium]|nr:hypothetical protein [Verrucomicrobiota bacterium]
MQRRRAWILVAAWLFGAMVPLYGQNLTYDTGKQVVPPDYATIRIGRLYSTITFHSAVSYRYTTSSGAGTDYIIDGQRGTIIEDGSDIPMVLAFDFRNYMPISAHSDMDFSVRVAYRYYPLGTQEDEWTVSVPDERISANFSTTYRITPRLNGVIFDRIQYVTDFVDFRGNEDDAAGRPYERVDNVVGTTLTWLLSEVSNLAGTLSRRDVIVTDNEEEFGDQERVEYVEGLTYTRTIFGRITAGARVGATQREYSDKTRPDTSQQDYDVFIGNSEGGGIPLTEATTLTLSLGTSAGQSDATDTEESSQSTTVTGSATLRTQLTKHLSHEIRYAHGLRSGFDTDFEESDSWGYAVNYTKEGAYVRVYSTYETVDSSDSDTVPYDQWVTGIAMNYPLLSYLTLETSYDYRVIYNGNASSDAVVAEDGTVTTPPAESQEDYFTRTARIGTALAIYKDVIFRTYVQRYERLSDLNELEFTRDTFEATLAYSHQF